ncbi:MAG: hypothetical protein LBG69_09265 [Zoogloeaceae bacterium]|jgi:hypothetical protein|nr:hypothetical protein [Zoogloeaceae bacterium]
MFKVSGVLYSQADLSVMGYRFVPLSSCVARVWYESEAFNVFCSGAEEADGRSFPAVRSSSGMGSARPFPASRSSSDSPSARVAAIRAGK